MAGGRPVGSKSRHKSTRRQTAEQKRLQVEKTAKTKAKTAATKAKNKKAEAAQKTTAGQAKWSAFGFGVNTNTTATTTPSVAAAAAAATLGNNNDTASLVNNTAATTAAANNDNTTSVNNNTTTTAESAAAVVAEKDTTAAQTDVLCAEENSTTTDTPVVNNNDDDGVVIITNTAVNGVINPDHHIAYLHYDEEEAAKKDSDDFADDNDPGIQQRYVAAVQSRLQYELSKNNKDINTWLILHLRQNDWCLPKTHFRWFIKKFNATVENKKDKLVEDNKAYYRDVHVWLPDVRWNTPDNRFMPCCPSCKSNARVGPHCFRDNHAGRVIVDMEETFSIISRRYICYECRDHSLQEKEKFEKTVPKTSKCQYEVKLDESQYTFMGWNQKSLLLLPYNKGNVFPAFLTWRAGVSKRVVTKIMQDVNSGKGFERISKDLLELHTELYFDRHLEYENDIRMTKDGGLVKDSFPTFSLFMDKLKYRGLVPTGAYLGHVYDLYSESIRPYLDKEVKLRDAETSLPNTVGRKRKIAAVGLSHTLVEPALPSHFQAPPPRALHNATFVQYGGMTIGNIPPPQPAPKKNQICTRCRQFGGMNALMCPGRGQHRYCKYFEKDGNPKRIVEPQRIRAPKMCSICSSIQCRGRGNRKLCPNYVDNNR